jgi:hypothetical protein
VALRRLGEDLGQGARESRDVIVGPSGDLERERMADAGGDPDFRMGQLAKAPCVRDRDHAILISPEEQDRDRAEIAKATVDADAHLLSPRKERAHASPASRLIRPDHRSVRERASPRVAAVANKPPHEPLILAACAAHEEAPDVRGFEERRPQQRASEQRHAIELVDPVKRLPERGRRDEHETGDEIRPRQRQVERHRPAERVTDEERAIDAEVMRDARDVVGELIDARVSRTQRRSQRESRKIDDMHGPAKTPKHPDLWRECAPVGGQTGDHERVGWGSAAPGRDAEPVRFTLGDAHLHARLLCNGRAFRGGAIEASILRLEPQQLGK